MRFLFISAHHDYRTPRRSSIHFIADELAKMGQVQFFSMRYSALSKRKKDIRVVVDDRANKLEVLDGVECFLWKTWIHPFNFRRKSLIPLENLFFRLYERTPPAILARWIEEADVVIYESGISLIFFELAKKLKPGAKHIYLGSDDLATINIANYAFDKFAEMAPRIDSICVVAKAMAKDIASTRNVYYVPHGLDPELGEMGEPSPYQGGINAVSVGSMLFDEASIEVMSQAFPEVTFHVIGSGQGRAPGYGPNVVVYGDMKYAETIRYIKHASIGLAPYVAGQVPVYLADSSMKMLQYDFFGLPTVCPHSVTGGYGTRFGYAPGDAESLKLATRTALEAPHARSRQILSWREVVDRLLEPARYADTRI